MQQVITNNPFGKRYQENYTLAPLTWLKVGGKCDIFFKPENLTDLQSFIDFIPPEMPIFTLGAGSNILIRDGGINGVVIKLNKFNWIRILENNKLEIGAGCLNQSLARFCLEHGISGLEFLSTIPGTIGGGIKMNAGAYGVEFKDVTDKICVFNFNQYRSDRTKNIITYNNEDINFNYRSSNINDSTVIISAILNYKLDSPENIRHKMNKMRTEREKSQPLGEKTAGSTFKNPKNSNWTAWQLIDQVGMRGHRIGDAQISEKHANFLINKGNVTAEELESLGLKVIENVFNAKQITLEWEVIRVGRNLDTPQKYINS